MQFSIKKIVHFILFFVLSSKQLLSMNNPIDSALPAMPAFPEASFGPTMPSSMPIELPAAQQPAAAANVAQSPTLEMALPPALPGVQTLPAPASIPTATAPGTPSIETPVAKVPEIVQTAVEKKIEENAAGAAESIKNQIENLKALKQEISTIVTTANTKIEEMHKKINQAYSNHQEILQAQTTQDAQAKAVTIQTTVQDAQALVKEFETLTATLNMKIGEIETKRAAIAVSLSELTKVSLKDELKEELSQALKQEKVKKESSNEKPQQENITIKTTYEKIDPAITHEKKNDTKKSSLVETVESEWQAKALTIFSYFLQLIDYSASKVKDAFIFVKNSMRSTSHQDKQKQEARQEDQTKEGAGKDPAVGESVVQA